MTLSVALPPPEDRAFADVWSALGGELKPSLDLVVTAPVDGGRLFPAGPPVEETLTIDFGGRAGEQRDPPRRKMDQSTAESGESASGESALAESAPDEAAPSSAAGTSDSGRPGGLKRTIRARRSPRGREPPPRKPGADDG